MSYEIIIKEKREVKRLAGKEWVILGTKEVPRDSIHYANRDEPQTRIENVHGYSPEIEKTVIEEREVFKQTVDELDLTTVVKAINGL